jgi:uncharacterized protein YjiS (DUF1127 family)
MIMSTCETAAHSLARPVVDRAGNGMSRFFRRLAVAFAIARERRALMALSDHTLKDIGLSRADAYREGKRSFWDVPVDRLR